MYVLLQRLLEHREDDERGSVPEWVMLLVMGIGIVMALWAIVQPQLAQIVTGALARLSS